MKNLETKKVTGLSIGDDFVVALGSTLPIVTETIASNRERFTEAMHNKSSHAANEALKRFQNGERT